MPRLHAASAIASVQFAGQRLALQRTHLMHHHSPDAMAGLIPGNPRLFSPDRGIELRLGPMQPDKMMGDMPKISIFRDGTVCATPPHPHGNCDNVARRL